MIPSTGTNTNASMQLVIVLLFCLASITSSFPITTTTTTKRSSLSMMALGVGKKYEPKWKKKQTLADSSGGSGSGSAKDKGLIGTIPVVFQQGNETRTTLAIPGQPLSDVASQAGQFIRYGCGKGECGTCESLCGGKWIRPCTATVPAALEPGQDRYVVTVKEIKSKTTSSGKFYSVKSFFMGFYNNLLGMVGFVKTRRAAKKNWEERREYEELIRTLTMEKRKERLAREAANAAAAAAAAQAPKTYPKYLNPKLRP